MPMNDFLFPILALLVIVVYVLTRMGNNRRHKK